MAERTAKDAAPPIATIGEIATSVDWIWLHCASRTASGADCGHCNAMKLAVAIARYGAHASTDAIRRNARCSACGGKGAMIQLPSFLSVTAGWQKYPGP